MERKKLYIVHKGDDLKSHLCRDSDGEKAVCGQQIEYYDKKVEEVDGMRMMYRCCWAR